MENPSNNKPTKKVNEPETVYKSISEIEEEESNSILNQLLEIGLKQIENGETRPHEEVMAEMKLKYNLKYRCIPLSGLHWQKLLLLTKSNLF